MSARLANSWRMLWVLWAGSLWSLAMWGAPLIFHYADDRHIAGITAAALFRVETYLTVLVAGLSFWRSQAARPSLVYLAAVALMLNEWVVKGVFERARIAGPIAGLSFVGWHGVSAALYVVACCCALWVVWQDDLR